jgi:cell division protein FtsQ
MLIGCVVFVVLIFHAKSIRSDIKITKILVNLDEWNGNFFVTKNQVVNEITKKYKVVGESLSGKKLENIELLLLAIPQIKKANAFIDNNGALTIKVNQRVPFFRVYNLQNESFYVDEDGIKFPTTANYTAKVQVITGVINESCGKNQKIQSKELKNCYAILTEIRKTKLWYNLVGQLNINQQNKIELIPRIGNATILFGDAENIDNKLKRLDLFYFEVLNKVGWEYYKVINIMYKDQVVCLK